MSAMTSVAAYRQFLKEHQQYLTFMLSGDIYSINTLCIKEIIQYGQLIEVPQMPDFIRGVINLRGTLIPVIDLSARFGKLPAPVGRSNGIIILDVAINEATYSVGVMVDAVNAVVDIPGSEIEPAPVSGTDIHAEFIAGMGKINGKFVIILNVEQVLSVDDMAVLATVESVSTAKLTQVSSYKVSLCGHG